MRGVLLLGIDQFKRFNDTCGHLAGDDCIRTVGACVRSRTGARRPVFRYGGEEILVLLPDEGLEAACRLAKEIRSDVEAGGVAHPAPRASAVATVSIGAAGGSIGALGFDALVAAADAALYEAKHAGRNRVAAAA